jgi:hypothetical protein
MSYPSLTRYVPFRAPRRKGGHRRGRTPPRQNRPHRLLLDLLEDRTVLSPYIVTTTADNGSGSFRDAMNQINADTSHTVYTSPSDSARDEIDFNITAASDAAGGGTGFNSASGVATFTPQSAYPTITNAVLINGYTQPGATPNTLALGDNATLKIQLDFGAVRAGNGIHVLAVRVHDMIPHLWLRALLPSSDRSSERTYSLVSDLRLMW